MAETEGQLAIVTGGGRGFGRCVVDALAMQPGTTWHFVLIARSMTDLEECAQIQRARGHTVRIVPADLGAVDLLPELLDQIFEPYVDLCSYKSAYLVNNSASLGPLKPIQELQLPAITHYMNLNVVSSRFLQVFAARTECRVVNVSSLLAVKAFAGWGLYGMAKAGRDMLHAIIALESTPQTKTLNYAPGPLDTEMQKEVRETLYDLQQRKLFADMKQEGKLVNPVDSAQKMVRLLMNDTYESGAHVDYYD